MRKSGWAAAAGLGSLALLLAACGGSSSSSSGGGSGSTPTTTTQAQPKPSSAVGLPAPGTTVLIVQKSKLGYVLAEANGQVVYTYSQDKKGAPPSCTGPCASNWPAVTGVPMVRSGDHFPAPLGTVSDANGAKQITYDGMPLYTFKGAKPLSVAGNGVGGAWHVVKLSASDISTGGA